MSWFTDLAKNALSEAQKKIDKALDIQGKEDNEAGRINGSEFATTLGVEETEHQERAFKKSQPNKPDLTLKKKGKPVSVSPRVKKNAGDINDDFFSVLDNQPTDAARKKNFGRRSAKSSTEPTEGTEQRGPSKDSENTQIIHTRPQETTYTEVSLVVGDDEIRPNEVAKLEMPSQMTTHNEGTELMVGESHGASLNDSSQNFTELSTPCPSSLEKASTQAEDSETIHPTPLEVDKNALPLSDGSLTERTVSPSSTVASSEIEILDHDSSVSEVSSRCTEGQLYIQSPSHVANADPTELDVSQAISADLQDFTRSSPQTVTEQCDISTQQNSDSLSSGYAFQPVEPCIAIANTETSEGQSDASQSTSKESLLPLTCSTFTGPEKTGDDKLMELSEKAEVYEQQLFNLSKKNAQLNEENDNLRSEITRLKEDYENKLKKEVEKLTNAAKSQESTNHVLTEEKANLLKQITVLKSQLASRMTNEQVQNAIAEKEESIKGLMEEGEVLAKKHLQQNNLIKKLKTQSQEKENELKSLREKASKYEAENARLKDELRLAQGQGQEERETSLRISDAYEQRERETQIIQEKLLQSEEKQRTLQVNLDAAYKEIGDLHKQIAEHESRTLAEWKEKESEINRENNLEKKKILSEQEHQRQLLMLQIMELNNSVSRAEASAARKDDDHRRELKELQQQLQESEGRNQDLSDNVSSATRPLLRQIENLQATHASQQRSWNALEKTLNNRLGEAQAELLASRESERVAQSALIEAKSKAVACEKHAESDQKTIAQQANQIASFHDQIEEYKSQVKSLSEELEGLKATQKEMMHKSRKERLFLENQLQMEKVRSEADRKKYTAQQEALQKEKDRLMWSRSEITSVSSNQIAETESVGSSNDAFHSADGLEKHLSSSSLQGLASQLSFDGGRAMSVSNVLENLQTQLKLRDGEIAQLKGEINMLERTRSSMAEEIVRLTNLNEDLDGVSKELKDMKEKLVQVENRYTAILTMYGEKEEENEELKMDLADVKAMYRQQINDLLKGEVSS